MAKYTLLVISCLVFSVPTILCTYCIRGLPTPYRCSFIDMRCPGSTVCNPVTRICCRQFRLPKPLPPTPPSNDICPYQDQVGRCGGFFQKGCPSGSICKPHKCGTYGICCVVRDVFRPCPSGVIRGTCGGYLEEQCSRGFTCQLPSNGIHGRCCQIERPGVCPPASPVDSNCQPDPSLNCQNDYSCPEGYKCCTDACGKTCKPVLPTVTPLPNFPEHIPLR